MNDHTKNLDTQDPGRTNGRSEFVAPCHGERSYVFNGIMKKLLLALFLVTSIAIVSVWGLGMPKTVVRDVRQSETIILRNRDTSEFVHSLTIRGSGEIDGTGEISLLLKGNPYKFAQVNGTVDFDWIGDWYGESAEVRYEPRDVRSGRIVLHYQFHTF